MSAPDATRDAPTADAHGDTSWVDRTEYPFETHCVGLSAGSVHYVDERPADGGRETLLFLHGNPTWSFLYREPIRALGGEYRCVAPDYLGFGLSEKPDPKEFPYRPEDHAAVLAEFVEELGLEDLILVVHDWGGPIGLSYALDNPENVRALVVQNTFVWPVDDRLWSRAFSWLAGGPLGRRLCERYDAFTRVVMPLAFADRSRFPERVRAQYRHPHDDPADRTGTWVFPREIVGETDWLGSLWERRWAIADHPALLVWGMKDPAFDAAALRTFEALFRECETVELDDVGHYVAEEAGDRLTDAMREFLAGLD
ncbi:alpha/beta fold hydrolase [Halomarina litorea]|uniref:alpha/beta fold hydrolase n=1 Tax=Halomarina litorea TaxID=2961595 RepID=UPI0020C2D01B|nr:alpha/beta fold hydrolase [Halomarina sp. BCD28]